MMFSLRMRWPITYRLVAQSCLREYNIYNIKSSPKKKLLFWSRNHWSWCVTEYHDVLHLHTPVTLFCPKYRSGQTENYGSRAGCSLTRDKPSWNINICLQNPVPDCVCKRVGAMANLINHNVVHYPGQQGITRWVERHRESCQLFYQTTCLFRTGKGAFIITTQETGCH